MEVSSLEHILRGIQEGIQLIIGFDKEIYSIMFLSLLEELDLYRLKDQSASLFDRVISMKDGRILT